MSAKPRPRGGARARARQRQGAAEAGGSRRIGSGRVNGAVTSEESPGEKATASCVIFLSAGSLSFHEPPEVQRQPVAAHLGLGQSPVTQRLRRGLALPTLDPTVYLILLGIPDRLPIDSILIHCSIGMILYLYATIKWNGPVFQ